MSLAKAIRPISYVKSHTAKLIKEVAESHSSVFITQNGEAKAVLQGLDEYEHTQETLAMLKLVAQGAEDVRHGRSIGIDSTFALIDQEIARLKDNMGK